MLVCVFDSVATLIFSKYFFLLFFAVVLFSLLFFSTFQSVAFLYFHSIFSFYLSRAAVRSWMERYDFVVIWNECVRTRDKCMMFAFLRGINEYEKGQTKKMLVCACACVCKTQNRGFDFTASFERTCHQYMFITIPVPLITHTHTQAYERKKGVWNFSVHCTPHTTQLFVLVWFFKNDAYLCDRQQD